MIERAMDAVTRAVGHPAAIPVALGLVAAVYTAAGVDVANIAISIVTLLLLPVLQHSQTKGDEATHAKLDELIRASNARDEFIGLDHKTAKEIERERCV